MNSAAVHLGPRGLHAGGVRNAYAPPFTEGEQVGAVLFSNESPPPTRIDLVPGIAPRATLRIWAPEGGNVETMNPMYQQLIGPSADIWARHAVKHINGLKSQPEEYERRVVGFFDVALLGAPATGGQVE